MQLPESYKQFFLLLGHGAFNDELTYSANEICALDSGVIELGELIAFATDDLGIRLAFDLKDASEGNVYAVYSLCHDAWHLSWNRKVGGG